MSARIPQYCRHATGQAFVQIKKKRRYLGVYGSEASLKEYHRIVEEIRATGVISEERSAGSRQKDISLSEVMVCYLNYAVSVHSRCYDCYRRWIGGNIQLGRMLGGVVP